MKYSISDKISSYSSVLLYFSGLTNYYDNSDSEWRRLGAIDKANNIQHLCNNLKIHNLIEIGAGDGSVLKELADRSFAKEFSALEISLSGAHMIKSRNINGLKECIIFDGYNTTFKNEEFDLAILSHVIEHVEHPRKLINEAMRIAKYLFIEVPCEDNMRLSNNFTFDKVGHINFFSPKTIRRLLQTCDLEITNQLITNPSKNVYMYKNGKKGILNFLIKQALLATNPSLATFIFTYHSSLICKKKENFKNS